MGKNGDVAVKRHYSRKHGLPLSSDTVTIPTVAVATLLPVGVMVGYVVVLGRAIAAMSRHVPRPG